MRTSCASAGRKFQTFKEIPEISGILLIVHTYWFAGKVGRTHLSSIMLSSSFLGNLKNVVVSTLTPQQNGRNQMTNKQNKQMGYERFLQNNVFH